MKKTQVEITSENALYPEKTAVELSPGEFLKEFRHGRPDVCGTDSRLNERTKSTKKTKLTEPMVRFIRANYKEIGKAKLSEMFSISTAFCYKVATGRAMSEVSEDGDVYVPGK